MSTTSKDIAKVRRLFRYHVPEIASGAVKIRGIAREVGKELIVAVLATKDGVCAVGSCVGVRGSFMKSIMRTLPGERPSFVRWSELPEELIRNLLQPAITERLDLDVRAKRATVTLSYRADVPTSVKLDATKLRLVSQIAGWEVRLAGQQV